MPESLADLLETTEPERLATGFEFTEGPVWHPDGFFYFVDIRRNSLHRLAPGGQAELVRDDLDQGNGTTFDLNGRLVMCEMGARRVIRLATADGAIEVIADRFEGKRLNRPNDVICHSDGSIYFTDPGMRMSLEEKELTDSGVYRFAPDGSMTLVANCEYPNGLALSADERTLYVANSRWSQYIHAIRVDAQGKMLSRRIFADMSSEAAGTSIPPIGGGEGVPDGMKLDAAGRVYCTGPGGTWVFAPDGSLIGKIVLPEVPANLAFGGEDLRTLFFTARTSVYSLRVKTPGQPHPWYARR